MQTGKSMVKVWFFGGPVFADRERIKMANNTVLFWGMEAQLADREQVKVKVDVKANNIDLFWGMEAQLADRERVKAKLVELLPMFKRKINKVGFVGPCCRCEMWGREFVFRTAPILVSQYYKKNYLSLQHIPKCLSI